jgi:hypothetical protein
VPELYEWIYTGRDPEWNDLNTNFVMHVVKAARIINLFPTFIKPYDSDNMSCRFLIIYM